MALKEGDVHSFGMIYTQYHSLIYYYALKFLQQKALAEEATSDVFIILWKKRALIDPHSTIQAFLYKIARDIAYNYLRKIASDARLRKEYLENYPIIEFKNGEVLFLEQERLELVKEVIQTLPPRRLEVFKLRYYEGLDNHKIAALLDISVSTVKVHLAKARFYLKGKLSSEQEFDLMLVWLSLGLIL